MDFEEALEFAVDIIKFLVIREFEYEDDSNVCYMINDNIQQ